MGFRHIGHLFNASAHCAHLLNDDENNAIKTLDFIINGYQQLYQNRDVYIYTLTLSIIHSCGDLESIGVGF